MRDVLRLATLALLIFSIITIPIPAAVSQEGDPGGSDEGSSGGEASDSGSNEESGETGDDSATESGSDPAGDDGSGDEVNSDNSGDGTDNEEEPSDDKPTESSDSGNQTGSSEGSDSTEQSESDNSGNQTSDQPTDSESSSNQTSSEPGSDESTAGNQTSADSSADNGSSNSEVYIELEQDGSGIAQLEDSTTEVDFEIGSIYFGDTIEEGGTLNMTVLEPEDFVASLPEGALEEMSMQEEDGEYEIVIETGSGYTVEGSIVEIEFENITLAEQDGITLALEYDETGLSDDEEQSIRILHFNHETLIWEVLQNNDDSINGGEEVDADKNIVYGTTYSFSHFVPGSGPGGPNPPTIDPPASPTIDNTPTITGTKDAGTSVELFDFDTDDSLGIVGPDESATWSITTPVLGDGLHQLFAVSLDAEGDNATSTGADIEIDTSLDDQASCEAFPTESSPSWDEDTDTCSISGTLMLDIDNDYSVEFGATLEITSSGSLDSDGEIDNFGNITNYGTITNTGSLDSVSYGHITNSDTGVIYNSGELRNFAPETLTNYGTIVNSGTLYNVGAFYNYGTLDIIGTVDNLVILNNDGTINIIDDGILDNTEGTINNDCNGVINGDVDGNPPLPACLFFEDTFAGGTVDDDNWYLDTVTGPIRWCSPDDTTLGSGTWQDTSIVTCNGATQETPYGAVGSGSSVSFSSGSSQAFPYIFSDVQIIPEDGDFVFETRMKFDSINDYGSGLHLRDWADSTPSGDNPPSHDEPPLQIWAGEFGEDTGIRVYSNGETVETGDSDDLSYHVYRLLYVDGEYSVYVDGVIYIGPIVSSEKPNTVWLGNPLFVSSGSDNWTNFTIDYIRVYTEGDNPVLQVDLDSSGFGSVEVSDQTSEVIFGQHNGVNFDTYGSITFVENGIVEGGMLELTVLTPEEFAEQHEEGGGLDDFGIVQDEDGNLIIEINELDYQAAGYFVDVNADLITFSDEFSYIAALAIEYVDAGLDPSEEGTMRVLHFDSGCECGAPWELLSNDDGLVVVDDGVNVNTDTNTAYGSSFLSLFTAGFRTGISHTGGPDDFGYTFEDSAYPGTEFDWIEISMDTEEFGEAGAEILTDSGGDAEVEEGVDIGFEFEFYGVTYETVNISSNGIVLFNTGDYSDLITNDPIGFASFGSAIAPFWDEVVTTEEEVEEVESAVFYKTIGEEPDRMFVVQWSNVYGCSCGDAGTFELVLYEGSNDIKFQYLDVDFDDPARDNGGEATVGIERSEGVGLQYSFDDPIVYSELAIVFTTESAEDQPHTGGPDDFGYSYVDSEAEGGPDFDFIDISGTGTEILSDEDLESENVTIGFDFDFYGQTYSYVNVTTKGMLAFDGYEDSFDNEPIDEADTQNFIAPFWDDLITYEYLTEVEDPEDFVGAGEIYYETQGAAPDRTFIVQWNNVQHYQNSSSGITFEVILYENTGEILFQYDDVAFGIVDNADVVNNPDDGPGGTDFADNGGAATVAIVGPDGEYLQYSSNDPVLEDGLTILFAPPDTEPPDAPVITSPIDGSITGDDTPEIAGTAEPGSTIEVFGEFEEETTSLGTTSTEDGEWTLAVSTELADGVHTFSAIAIDDEDNNSPLSDEVTVTVDTTAPSAIVLLYPPDGAATSDSTPVLNWTFPEDATAVEHDLLVDNNADFTSPEESFSSDLSVPHTVVNPLADGTYYWKVRATDEADNVGEFSSVFTFTVDTEGPLSVEPATDLGPIDIVLANGELESIEAIAESDLPDDETKPEDWAFPFGFFSWTVTGLEPGETITMTLTYPTAVAAGSSYWKVIDGEWVDASEILGSNDGDEIITLTVTDGGFGDVDEEENGEISDPGGVGEEMGEITIRKVELGTDPEVLLPGSAFTITPSPFTLSGSLVVEDNDENDSDPADGIIAIHDVIFSTYTLEESQVPEGFERIVTSHTVAVHGDNPAPVVTVENRDEDEEIDEVIEAPPPQLDEEEIEEFEDNGAEVNGEPIDSADDLPPALIAPPEDAGELDPDDVIFAQEADPDATGSDLFTDFSIPTYAGPDESIASEVVYAPPAFVIPKEDGSNFVLTPIIEEIFEEMTLLFFPPEETEVTSASIQSVEVEFGQGGSNVGFSFELAADIPEDLPEIDDIEETALFLDVDFVGDVDFSDPDAFASPPEFIILVSTSLDGETLPDGCPDIRLYLLNEVTDEWEVVETPDRNPDGDTADECSYIVHTEHFSKFAVGSVKGTITQVDSSAGHDSNRKVIVFGEGYFEINPLARVSVAETEFITVNGQSAREFAVGETVVVSNTIGNNQPDSQPYVFIVQILDEGGMAQSISWSSGVLESQQIVTLGRSWTAGQAGDYQVRIYVWTGWDAPAPLSDVAVRMLEVSEAGRTESV